MDLTPELLKKLEQQARQNLSTPEQHAATLLKAALTAPLFQTATEPPEIKQHEVKHRPRQLGPGTVTPTGPHHITLWEALNEGGTLTEIGPNIWSLKTSTGSRPVDRRTVATLLTKGILKPLT